MITAIGLAAAFLTTLAFVPQVFHILRTKRTEGISLSMYSAFTTGVFCWLLYGILTGDLPLLLANGVTFALAMWVLILTAVSRRRQSRPSDALAR